jgi:uncharacterized protein
MYFAIEGTELRVLGTMHRLPAAVDKLPDWVTAAYDWAPSLVLECGEALSPANRLGAGQNLATYLPAATYAFLRREWRKKYAPFELSRLKPWAAFLELGGLLTETTPGVEAVFSEWAIDDKKGISYLESAAEIAATFETVPRSAVVAAIDRVRLSPDRMRSSFERLYLGWRESNADQLLALYLDTPEAIRDAMFSRRNAAWAPRIQKLCSSLEPSLLVVGALHLCGDDSIQNLIGRRLVPVH